MLLVLHKEEKQYNQSFSHILLDNQWRVDNKFTLNLDYRKTKETSK